MLRVQLTAFLITILFACVYGQNSSIQDNKLIQERTISFTKTIDNASIDEFKRIKLGDEIKVFGLGEANHGTREFQLLKWKLTEYLIYEKGLNTIVIEFPYSHGLLLNEYVKGKNDEGIKILSDQKNSEYKNVDFINFINEVKKINKDRSEVEKINFLGGRYLW